VPEAEEEYRMAAWRGEDAPSAGNESDEPAEVDPDEAAPGASAAAEDEQRARERSAEAHASRSMSQRAYEEALRALKLRRAELDRKIREFEKRKREFATKRSEYERDVVENQRRVEMQAEKLAEVEKLARSNRLSEAERQALARELDAERGALAQAPSDPYRSALEDKERAALELERALALQEGRQGAAQQLAEAEKELELVRRQQGLQSKSTQELEREVMALRDRLAAEEKDGTGSQVRSRAAMDREIAALHRALALQEKNRKGPDSDQAARELREQLRLLEEERRRGSRLE